VGNRLYGYVDNTMMEDSLLKLLNPKLDIDAIPFIELDKTLLESVGEKTYNDFCKKLRLKLYSNKDEIIRDKDGEIKKLKRQIGNLEKRIVSLEDLTKLLNDSMWK
jgi:hypothetical protein